MKSFAKSSPQKKEHLCSWHRVDLAKLDQLFLLVEMQKGAAAAAFLPHTGGTREVQTANSTVLSGTETQDVSEEESFILNVFS